VPHQARCRRAPLLTVEPFDAHDGHPFKPRPPRRALAAISSI
jgi:hypothetical protein